MNTNWQFSLFQCDFNFCRIKTSNINLVCIYYAMDQTKKCIIFVLAFVINSSLTQKCNYAILFLEPMLYTTLNNGICPYTFCFYAFKISYQILVLKTYWCIMLDICIKTIHDIGITLSTVNSEIENCVLMEMHRMITLLLEAI